LVGNSIIDLVNVKAATMLASDAVKDFPILGVGNEQARPGVFQHVLDARQRERRIDGDVAFPRLQNSQQSCDRLNAVTQK
jgi:hypothetical protein